MNKYKVQLKVADGWRNFEEQASYASIAKCGALELWHRQSVGATFVKDTLLKAWAPGMWRAVARIVPIDPPPPVV